MTTKIIKKSIAFFFLINIFCLISFPSSVFAAEEDFSNLIGTVFDYSIRSIGIISLAVLIYGGIKYLFSTSSVAAKSSAQKQIIGGIAGLMIVVFSYLILQTINPQLLQPILNELPPGTIEEPSPPPPSEETVFGFQEIPFGMLLEERILAKNISCFDDSGELADCRYDQFNLSPPIPLGELERIAEKMKVDFPEQWPNAIAEDAEIAYLCYAFDDEGDFLNEAQPITRNDRLDCLKRISEAIQIKGKELRDKSKRLADLSQQCACGYCSCGGCPCPPAGSCRCGAVCSGDPCPGRGEMNQIREKVLNMKQVIGGHNCLEDSELVHVSTEDYSQLTTVNKLRYLAYHFLPAYKSSLEVDLSYLEKAEGLYKSDCQYQTIISHSAFYDIKEITKERTKQFVFCLNDQPHQWGEECDQEQQLDITKYCRDFNCKDCEEDGEKISCGDCDLDKLEKGTEVEQWWNNQTQTSYKCSKYLINNEQGKDERMPSDEEGIICRVEPETNENQGEERECYVFDQDAFTFYCPKPFSERAEKITARQNITEGVVDTEIEDGFPVGTASIGELIDDAEAYIEKLIPELTTLVETSVPEEACPVYDKKDPGNQCTLYNLPPRCLCNSGTITTQDSAATHCKRGGCYTTHGCRCNDCGACPGCPCSTCNAPSMEMHPCPLSIIFRRSAEVNQWFEEEERSVKKRTDHLIDLIEAKNLKEDDPSRTELINQLMNVRQKLETCITGFGENATTKDLFSCSILLDKLSTSRITIFPDFKNCYPYNSDSPYGNNALSEDEKKACSENQDGLICQEAVKDLMLNYFCAEAGEEEN
jgi:hypothetical protein